jgi:hypothetical protein
MPESIEQQGSDLLHCNLHSGLLGLESLVDDSGDEGVGCLMGLLVSHEICEDGRCAGSPNLLVVVGDDLPCVTSSG